MAIKDKKKKILICILFVLIIMLLVCVFLLNNTTQVVDDNDKIPINFVDGDGYVVNTDSEYDKELWKKNKEINNDYVGEIIFDSGLINNSFVQAKSMYDSNGNIYHCYDINGALIDDAVDRTGNDVYIYTNWKDMSYDYNILCGSIFMDYRNSLDDQNLLIYGHHYSENSGNDPERVKAFTPLEKLLYEENYADNKIVKLVLENEIREYELAYVYEFNSDDDYYWDNCQYWRTNYNYDDYTGEVDNTYYSKYIDALEEVSLYDTGVSINTSYGQPDNTLTLQTCISNHTGELFEILVFKQISVSKY